MRSLILLLLLSSSTVIYERAYAGEPSQAISMQVFYETLRPYGTWVDHPAHGLIWLPMEDPQTFYPYGSQGFWIYTDYGWTWLSIYPWGWATFHYGRWGYEQPYGWYWVPDTVWGPAWVQWRTSPGHFGWAPMPPRITATDLSSKASVPDAWWIFSDNTHFGYRVTNGSYASSATVAKAMGKSKVLPLTCFDKERDITYVTGPEKAVVEKQIGRQVEVLTIEDLAAPGQKIINGMFRIYRPLVYGMILAGRTTKVEDFRALCPVAEDPVLPSNLIVPTTDKQAASSRP